MSDGTPPVPPTGIPRASPAGADAALVPLERPDGRTQWTFEHAGRCYAVFAVGDELHVTDGACPHHGGPLAEGLVRDGVVTCPWHWYSYELATGRCRTAAGYELRRYPVVLAGGRPHAALPAAAPAPSWSQILRAHAQQATLATGAGPDLRFRRDPIGGADRAVRVAIRRLGQSLSAARGDG